MSHGEEGEGVERQVDRQLDTPLHPRGATAGNDAPPCSDARENRLRLWRSAAQVVRSDPVDARRTAYEAAIDEVLAQLPPLPTFEALMDSYGTVSRASIAAIATRLRHDGRLMNEVVVAGAACWIALSSQLETRASHSE